MASSASKRTPQEPRRVNTGIEGLDVITKGGLPEGEMYVVQGAPGAGKTILSLQFLQAGVEAGERCMFIALSQREASLRSMIASHGLALDELEIVELAGSQSLEQLGQRQTIFPTAEIELEQTRSAVLEAVERHAPQRVVFDAVSELRLLAGSPGIYRRQLLALRDYFAERETTVLLTDNQDLAPGEGELSSLAHGTILLDLHVTPHGEPERTIQVAKCRNTAVVEGRHDFVIHTGGLTVFPRVTEAPDSPSGGKRATLECGVAGVDRLLGGGISAGTASLLIGPPGTGKSTVASLYACAAAQRGQQASVFLFDESPWTYLTRSDGLGIPVREQVETGRIRLHHIHPTDISVGGLLSFIRTDVLDVGSRVVVFDSLSGYLSAMAEQAELLSRMQQLLSFLAAHDVYTFSILAQSRGGSLGPMGPVHVSYLADIVLLFRIFEHKGRIRQGMSVYKKRYGNHERTIRELSLAPGKVSIGQPLSEFVGMIDGRTLFRGGGEELMEEDAD